MRIKILFLINSLRPGGAEKVLVNLVNYLSPTKYDITVMTLFGGGTNKQFLSSNIKLIELYRKAPFGFVHVCKLFSPELLHKYFIKEQYDIEISYLQGVTTRIIGGAPSSVKAIAWMHNCDHPEITFKTIKERNRLLQRFDRIVSVSNTVEEKVRGCVTGKLSNCQVIYNTQDVSHIIEASHDLVPIMNTEKSLKFIAIGTLYDVKGYLRLLKSLYKLKLEKFNFKMYFVGDGPQRKELEEFVKSHGMREYVTFFGFDKNPYKYLAKADLFICSSYTEGFSGTVSEATILGIPTLTTECAGMKEILGEHNEYGIVVENSDKGLEEGIRNILDNPDILKHYKEAVRKRSDFFKPEKTVSEVESMFDNLVRK